MRYMQLIPGLCRPLVNMCVGFAVTSSQSDYKAKASSCPSSPSSHLAAHNPKHSQPTCNMQGQVTLEACWGVGIGGICCSFVWCYRFQQSHHMRQQHISVPLFGSRVYALFHPDFLLQFLQACAIHCATHSAFFHPYFPYADNTRDTPAISEDL
eukprot:GHUV01021298.1.p1 GENE.GHUV01021298.1~~GHUV01021298.1.p1  ORF type:complete len:154 (-),score=16.95 GHUV01021298.1:463-924(-)